MNSVIVGRVSAVVVLAACAAAIFFSIRWGMADVSAQSGYGVMNNWNAANPVTQATWDQAYSAIQRAHELDPGHPTYLQRLARLHRILITEGLIGGGRIADEGAQSIAYLQRSIEIRPRWGFTWAELALVHWLLDDTGEDFWQALETAMRVGPWEPGVIQLVTFLGLQELQDLDDSQREAVIDNVVRGLRSPSSKVYDNTFAEIRDRADLKPELVAGLMPYLTDERWRPSVRYNFFRLADWVWASADEVQQRKLTMRAIEVLRQVRPQYTWIRNASKPGYKQALCDVAVVESPGDVNLGKWCGVE